MKKQRSGWPLFWHVVAVAFAVVLVTAGLAAIGMVVVSAIAVNAWASNK